MFFLIRSWYLSLAFFPFRFFLSVYFFNFTCCVGDGDFLFEVDTDVKHGCVMSTLLFNLIVNWIMRRTIEDQFRGIR